MIRVAVNGFGTIGKRVAWAVSRQPDMKIVGVSKTKPDWEARLALKWGLSLYVPREAVGEFESRGIDVAGTIEDMIASSDVVVDATPSGTGARYRPLYEGLGVRAVFQGGEKREVAELSFNPLVNFREALGRRFLRVLSCNTTGMARIVHSLAMVGGLERVFAVIVRRGADLREAKKGPVEGLILESLPPPSHHAADLKELFPKLDVSTYAVVAPTTLAHLHILSAQFKSPVGVGEVLEALRRTPRVLVLDGIASTAELRELARLSGRPFGDVFEVAVWESSVRASGNVVTLAYAVHQEAVVIPDNVDAVRAVAAPAVDPAESMRLTDETLGVGLDLKLAY